MYNSIPPFEIKPLFFDNLEKTFAPIVQPNHLLTGACLIVKLKTHF
jgi:hypothetical protein